jgi:hypothetical protein
MAHRGGGTIPFGFLRLVTFLGHSGLELRTECSSFSLDGSLGFITQQTRSHFIHPWLFLGGPLQLATHPPAKKPNEISLLGHARRD